MVNYPLAPSYQVYYLKFCINNLELVLCTAGKEKMCSKVFASMSVLVYLPF